jgi:aminobenzoyl-glutamate transport protein
MERLTTMSDTRSTPLSQRWLNRIEHIGNRLPHPTALFIAFSLLVVLLSALFTSLGSVATHPGTGEVFQAKSLLSSDGLRWMLQHAVSNFMSFAPVGPVVVAIMGIAIAEHSGLLGGALSRLAKSAPPKTLSAAVVFCGVISSLGFDAGYVVLIPLAGLIFKTAGRPPLAGIAAAFAGVSGGYSANLILGPVDAILGGISSEAVQLLDPNREVLASANYYFIIISTLFITLLGSQVNDRLIEPRLAALAGEPEPDPESNHQAEPAPTDAPNNALKWVGLFTLAYIAGLFWLVLPDNALLRNPDPTGLAALPLLKSIVVFIALYAALAGCLYGYLCGRYRKSGDWIIAMEEGVATLASYLVLMFFAAQFVNYFAWSGLGTIAAINGAEWLSRAELSSTSLLLAFILTSAAINLLIGSASAKWALMAPVFLPMLMMVGVAPEAAQMAYRIGDSSTNIITPLMPYFGVVVAFAQRHQADTGMGTLIALMLPYSLVFLIGWSGLLLVWTAFGLPLGPG